MSMDPKLIMKTAQERIAELDKENAVLRKEAQDTKSELQGALKKLAYYEREKKVDHILDILIDEKNYFPAAQRQEKRAYLMDDKTDLDAFLKMAGELNPRDPGMFYEADNAPVSAGRDENFYSALMNKLARGMYGE